MLGNGVSNGTNLWLGGQALALFLAHNLPALQHVSHDPTRPLRVIELGSGIGLTACVFHLRPPPFPEKI